MNKETSCIFHNNGGGVLSFESKGFLYFDQITTALCKDRSLPTISDRSDLAILICHNYREKQITERTLNHLGYNDYHILGQGIKRWDNIIKISLVLDFIKESRATYIMVLDGIDVAVCGDPSLVVERFRAIPECEMLCNAETVSYPSSAGLARSDPEAANKLELIENFERSHYDTKFSHLNAGCYIARRESLVEFLEAGWKIRNEIGRAKFNTDDQRVLRALHRRFYPRIQMDSTCRIFQCLYGVRKEDVSTTYSLSDSWSSRLRQAPLLLEKAHHIAVNEVRLVSRKVRRSGDSVSEGLQRRFPRQHEVLRRIKNRLIQG